MSRQSLPALYLPGANAGCQDVPHRVHFHMLAKRFHFAQDNLAHFLLIAETERALHSSASISVCRFPIRFRCFG
jgi:hypothetical protein